MPEQQPSAQDTGRAEALNADRRKDARKKRDAEFVGGGTGKYADIKKSIAALKGDIDRSKHRDVFLFALLTAVANDFADPLAEWAGTAIQPVVGTVTFSWLETMASWGLTFFTWWYLTSNGWFKDSERRIRFIFWVVSFFLEGIPFVKELPLHTVVTVYAWLDIQEKGSTARRLLAAKTLVQRARSRFKPVPAPA